MENVNVLFLAAEADPFIKIGGLGDVAGSLPSALIDLGSGVDVRLIIPFHKALNLSGFSVNKLTEFTFEVNGLSQTVEVYETKKEKLEIFFINGKPIEQNEKVYDSDILKDGEKYIFFSHAALEFSMRNGWRPDVVMANDWHSAISLHLIKQATSKFWKNVRTVFTIHNLAYMGAGTEQVLLKYGIQPVETAQLPWWGKHVPLPMGLLSADKIVTVSPSYAKEIQTEEFGCGLDGYFRSRSEDIVGIVNGIDLKFWDPEIDENIPSKFTKSDLTGKHSDKAFLQEMCGFTIDPATPLMAMVTRMDQQKGVDILVDALSRIMDRKFQVLILGTGNPAIEENCRLLEADHPEKVKAMIKFDSKLSRQIYAGADMVLMPSRYEPCGIAQMISMRYGSVPIARSTGGLRDTIVEGQTGFLFTKVDAGDLALSILKAVDVYNNKSKWSEIQQICMGEDFSWEKSARLYSKLFTQLAS